MLKELYNKLFYSWAKYLIYVLGIFLIIYFDKYDLNKIFIFKMYKDFCLLLLNRFKI